MTEQYDSQSWGPGVAYKDYTVYDQHYNKVGRVDDLFVDERDEPEYIGVKMGLLGTRSTLIPMELVRVNDRRQLVEVATEEETIKHAPTFDDDNDITPDFEHRVHAYFGLERPAAMHDSTLYGGYYDSDIAREAELRRAVDTEFGERAHSPEHRISPSTSDRESIDVPIEGSGTTPKTPATDEPGGPLDADAATRTEGETREGVEVQGDQDVRVFKRARR